MSTGPDYITLFNSDIELLFGDIVKTCLKRPSLAKFFVQTAARQKRAALRRREWEERGVHVPPLVIASITNRCNLKCSHCYARAHSREPRPELPGSRWNDVFRQAAELGVSLVMIAGGEPFVRPEFLETTKNYPEIIFPVFTNGLLLRDGLTAELKKQRHVIPILSIEGFEQATDERRGEGVYQALRQAIERLEEQGLFFGVSLTLTRTNFQTLTGDGFVRSLVDSGCRVFIYVEYTPIEEDTENMVLTAEQKASIDSTRRDLSSRYNAVFVAFPGDETPYGGCLAAGRGFIHIGPDGSLEPCPFAPFSDTSVAEVPLKDALQSEFLARLREGHERLTEAEGGCELWANRDWVASLLHPKVRQPAS